MVKVAVRVTHADLHPIAMHAFSALTVDLQKSFDLGITQTLFLPFEGVRTVQRQRELLKDRTTRAGAWESPHQYGLAVDYVPNVKGVWSWGGHHDWEFLRKAAKARGLLNEMDWDRAHVEHPAWKRLWGVLWPRSHVANQNAASISEIPAEAGNPTGQS